MTFSKFEKYAAGKIKNHTSEVDAEGVWNDILPSVQKDNNRWRGLIWFFFIGLIASFAVVYSLTDNENSDAANEITALSSLEIINESNKAQTLNSIGDDMVGSSTSENQNEQSTPTTSNNFQPRQRRGRTQITGKNYQANHQPEKYKATITGQLQNQGAIEKLSYSELANDQMILKENRSEVADHLANDNPIAENPDFFENNEASPSGAEQADTFETKGDGVLTQGITEEQALPTIELSAEVENELPRRRNNFKIKYGFGLYGGWSSSFVSLKDKDGMNSDYLQLRLQTEEQLETIQMGIEAMAKSEIGVYFKTGLQYSRIARKFSLNSSIETVDTVHGVQRIYINNTTNDTIYVYGPVPVTTTKTYNKVTYNYFHLMDIPLVLGYNYRNENWSLGVEAGALVNISTKRKGEIMESQNEIYDIKEDRLGWFKDNIGVGFIASVIATYHVNDNFQIYLSPTARLESIFSTDANPIEQKHGALGVNIGARYFIGY